MRRLPPALVGSLFVLFAMTASSAEARIGIPKKVKDTVAKSAEQKAAPQAPEEPVVFDDVTLELTDARLTEILTICARVDQLSAGRPALVERVDKANEERAKFMEKNEEKMQRLRDKRAEVEACQHEAYGEIRDRKTQDYAQRALTDPVLIEKYKNAAMKYNEAASKGDSVAIQKLNEVMYSEILPSKEDSANVVRKCGTVPPVSAEEKRLEALDKEIAAAQQAVRDHDEKIADEIASEKGAMNRQQWAMATERIQMFLSQKGTSKNDHPGFSEDEVKAMEKRLEELKKTKCTWR